MTEAICQKLTLRDTSTDRALKTSPCRNPVVAWYRPAPSAGNENCGSVLGRAPHGIKVMAAGPAREVVGDGGIEIFNSGTLTDGSRSHCRTRLGRYGRYKTVTRRHPANTSVGQHGGFGRISRCPLIVPQVCGGAQNRRTRSCRSNCGPWTNIKIALDSGLAGRRPNWKNRRRCGRIPGGCASPVVTQ